MNDLDIITCEEKSFSTQPGAQDDKYFFGRKNEINSLHFLFENSNHCALRAIRQYGKTALAHKALDRYKERNDVTVITIDLTSSNSVSRLGEKIMNSYINENTGKNKLFKSGKELILNSLSSLIDSLNIKVKIPGIEATFGNLENNVNSGEEIEAFVNRLSLIDLFSKIKDKKTIIFIDEIQEIIDIAGESYGSFAKKFRSVLGELDYTTVIIAGSELSIIDSMIQRGNKNFFASLTKFSVSSIMELEFKEHLEKACDAKEVYIELDIVAALCSKLTNGIASNLAFFGNKILSAQNSAIKPIGIDSIIEIAFECIDFQEPEYSNRRDILENIDAGFVVYKSIDQSLYESLDEETKEAYDDVVDKLKNRMYIYSHKDDEVKIEDPLFSLYLFTKSSTARNRLLKKITASPALIENLSITSLLE